MEAVGFVGLGVVMADTHGVDIEERWSTFSDGLLQEEEMHHGPGSKIQDLIKRHNLDRS